MAPIRMMLLALSAGVVLGTAAAQTEADVTNAAGSHPSGRIVARKVFDLNSPTTARQEQTDAATPGLFLAGIVSLTGKKALIKAVLRPEPGEPAKEESYMLGEGERKGDLEVMAIDEKARTVRVTWAGTAASLNFRANAVNAAAVTPPSPANLPTTEAAPSVSEFYAALRQLGYLPDHSIGSRPRGGGRDRQALPTEVWGDSEGLGAFFPRPIPRRIWPGALFAPVYSSAFGFP